jgi:hypothetical protein
MSLLSRLCQLAALLAVALALVACSPAGGPGAAPSDGSSGAAPNEPTNPPVARTTPDVLADQAALDGATIAVAGFFTTDGTTHKVCDAVLESYPPQCGGAVIEVLGTVPPEAIAMLEAPDEPDLARVAWGNVEIRGTFHAAAGDARPTLELSEIRVVP